MLYFVSLLFFFSLLSPTRFFPIELALSIYAFTDLGRGSRIGCVPRRTVFLPPRVVRQEDVSRVCCDRTGKKNLRKYTHPLSNAALDALRYTIFVKNTQYHHGAFRKMTAKKSKQYEKTKQKYHVRKTEMDSTFSFVKLVADKNRSARLCWSNK